MTPAPIASDGSPPRASGGRSIYRIVALGLALVVAAYFVGLWSPWSAHHTRTVVGTVDVNGYDPNVSDTAAMPVATLQFDDERILFRLDAVNWRDGQNRGMWSIPPCLRTAGAHVEVEAEVIKLSRTSLRLLL
jgi:hypothetical protein